jgi:hypothetical protein
MGVTCANTFIVIVAVIIVIRYIAEDLGIHHLPLGTKTLKDIIKDNI